MYKELQAMLKEEGQELVETLNVRNALIAEMHASNTQALADLQDGLETLHESNAELRGKVDAVVGAVNEISVYVGRRTDGGGE